MPVNDVYWDGDHEGVDVDYDDDGFKNSVACDYGLASRPHNYTPKVSYTHRKPNLGVKK